MSTQQTICLPRELIAKYSPNGGEADIIASPNSLYFRCGPEVSNQIREFLASRGWQDLSYAQIHPVDYPTLILPDILEAITHSLKKFTHAQRIALLKTLQSKLNREMQDFFLANVDPVTGRKPQLTNKHPNVIFRAVPYYNQVPGIWNLWWEDNGFNPVNISILQSHCGWNHLFTLSQIFRKDGLQKEMMFYNNTFGDTFKGVIPKGWVLSTEHKAWNNHIINLIKNDPKGTINIVIIDPNGVLKSTNSGVNTNGDDSNTDEGLVNINDNDKPIDPSKPTVYISFTEENMVQCTSYDPRTEQPPVSQTDAPIPTTTTTATPATTTTTPTSTTAREATESSTATTTATTTTTTSVIPKTTKSSSSSDHDQANYLPTHVTDKAVWIAKPSGGARGEGIFVFNNLDKLNDKIASIAKKKQTINPKPSVTKEQLLGSDTPSTESTTTQTDSTESPQSPQQFSIPPPKPQTRVFTGTMTVQEYINNNMLVGTPHYKFDLRLYVLVVSHFPLEIYIHRMGIVRVASSPYVDDINNTGAHLTNFTVGKKLIGKEKKSSNVSPSSQGDDNENDQEDSTISTSSTSQTQSPIDPLEPTATRLDKRYDGLKTDKFDAATYFSDGLKWTLDEFRSYISRRKTECDELGLPMKNFDQIWLDIKHLVMKALLPSIPSQCYARGATPSDIYKNTMNGIEDADKSTSTDEFFHIDPISTPVRPAPNNPTIPKSQSESNDTVWNHLFTASLNNINPMYRGYELLGIDVMLTNDGSPVLIEMNRSPAMVVQTPADFAKTQVLHDVFNMLKIEQTILHAKRVKYAQELIDSTPALLQEQQQQRQRANGKGDRHVISIGDVDVPFNWRNTPGCFWAKYRPDYQLVTNSCPYPNKSMEDYPIEDSQEDEEDDDDDDDITVVIHGDDGNNDQEKANDEQGNENTTTSTGTKINSKLLANRAQNAERERKLKKKIKMITKDYMDTAFDCFNVINTNVPVRVRKLIKSSNYQQQKTLQHDNLDAKWSNSNEQGNNTTVTAPNTDLKTKKSNIFIPSKAAATEAGSEPLPGDNEPVHIPLNDNGDVIVTSPPTQKKKGLQKLSQVDIVKYPFSQPHNFQRIYPLNISNYIDGYFDYKTMIEKELFQREGELVKEIEPFITARMNRLTDEQSNLIKEYQSVQYSLCHVDHLIEYKYFQRLFSSSPLNISVDQDGKDNKIVDGETSEFDNSFTQLYHPLRLIKRAHLYTKVSLPPQFLKLVYPPQQSKIIQLTAEEQQNDQGKHFILLQQLAYMITLTSQHAFHWFQQGFGTNVPPINVSNKLPFSLEKKKIAIAAFANTTKSTNPTNNDPEATSTTTQTTTQTLFSTLISQLPTLTQTPYLDTPSEIETTTQLIRLKPLDMRISKGKGAVSQYIIILARYLMWYHHQFLGDVE